MQAFGGRVEFGTQTRSGDKFKILVEEERLGGEFLRYGPVQAIEYVGANTGGLPNITDNGYQMQTSMMALPQVLQLYGSWSQIFGNYGDPWEWRVGQNWYFLKQRGVRVNAEFIHVNKSPVGYTAYPMPVGANGNVIHLNFEMNF